MTTPDDVRATLDLARRQLDEVVEQYQRYGDELADLLGTAHGRIANLEAEVGRLTQELADCQAQPAPTPSPGPEPTPERVQVGVFRSPSNRANVDEHSGWQGRPNQWAVTFHGKGAAGPEKLAPVLAAHEGGQYRLNVRLALAGGWGTLEEVAAGEHDWRYTEAARALQAADRADSVISLGWEPNMNGFPWKAQGREATYVKAFQSAVDAMRSVCPPMEFSYDLLIGNQAADWRKAYPGDAWVDWIGLDAYDNSPISSTGSVAGASPLNPAARWQHLLDRPVGLHEVFDFAYTHDRQMACFEWGCLTRFDRFSNLSGGDNPVYIHRMFELARDREIVLCYFEDDDGATGSLHRLMGATSFPKAAAAYKDEVRK